MTIVEFQRGITTKLYRQESRILYSARHLMMLYISMKFHDKFLERFSSYRADTNLLFSNLKGNNSKMYRQELWFLWSACRLMMLYICMKFHENILNGFQVIEQTRLRDGRTDRQPRQNNIYPPLSRGDIIKENNKTFTGQHVLS